MNARPRGIVVTVSIVPPEHPARDLRELFTEDDKGHIRLCVDAEARGDVDEALEHYLAAPYVEGSPQLVPLLGKRLNEPR